MRPFGRGAAIFFTFGIATAALSAEMGKEGMIGRQNATFSPGAHRLKFESPAIFIYNCWGTVALFDM